jgi:hypothetical protein
VEWKLTLFSESAEVDSVATDEEKVSVKFKGNRTIVEKIENSNDVYAWGQGPLLSLLITTLLYHFPRVRRV